MEYFGWPFIQIYNQGLANFYLKNKFQEITDKNINVLHYIQTEMRDIIVSLSIEILKNLENQSN